MISVRQYLFSVTNSHGLTRTLGELDLCRDAAGRPLYSVGNSAVVFRIRHRGRLCALRCYTHPARHLVEIYGDRLLHNELFVYCNETEGRWTDVVLDRWIEGETLHERISRADRREFQRLAHEFDGLGASLVADEWAHGDLKPENLIVTPEGGLCPIDLDATFLPAFAGEESPELGTAAFQHPARTSADYDAHLDDFPVALIATALHALGCDPSLRTRYGTHETLLIDPQRLPQDPALQEILTLFEGRCMAAAYRIARLLLLPTLHLPGLADLLREAARTTPTEFPFSTTAAATTPSPHHTPTAQNPSDKTLELFAAEGLWGYRDTRSGDTVIAPLYDCGFDFTEGLAAVRLGQTWHFIDPTGRPALHCPNFDAVKPFRDGRALGYRAGRRCTIDRTGRVVELEY